MKNDHRITVGLSDQDAPMQPIPSDDSVQAQYVVCKGATCSCDGNPSAKGTLMVTSQKKYSINDKGADKLVATVEDTAFEEGIAPFITCSYKKGTDKTCTYAAQGNWIVPNNTKFPEVAGKAILTETGSLCCTLGGTLTFMTHGQTVDVDNDEVQEVEDAFGAMRVINALLSYEELPSVEQKYPEEYVSDVAQLECIPSEDVVLTPMSEGNTRAFYVLKGQFVEFSATTKVNTADPHKRRGENISWGLTEILEDGVFAARQSSISKTYKLPPTDQEKVLYQGYKRVANPFGFVFTKSGHYIIDASSREKIAGTTWSYYKDQYCYIQVVDQASILALRLSVVDQAILVGEEVILTVISDLPLSPAVLSTLTIVVCSVAKTGEESLEYIYRDAAIEPINGSKRYTQKANKLEAKFKCVNSGLFRMKVLQDGQELTAFTQTIEVGENQVLAIESVEGRVRRGSVAVFRAILKRGGRLDTAKINWRLQSPKGRTYEVSEVGVTHEFEFKEVGTYTLQCFYGNQISFYQEKVEKKIEVLDNEIEGVTLRNTVVKEEGKNYAVFVNQGIVININMPLDYSYEAVIPDISAWSSVLNFHTSKEEAFAYIAQSKSKKDPLLLYGISYMSKGANQIKGTIKIGNRITKIIGATPVYFTGSTAELALTLADEGMYFLSIQLGQSTPVEVVLNSCKGKIKQWFFHDGQQKTTQLGYKQIFGIAATVEGWANKKGKLHIWWDNRTNGETILKYFQIDATIEKERHHLIYSQDVTFDCNGVLNKTIGVDSAFWKNLQQVVDQQQAKDKIFNFYFTLSEVEVPCENQNEAVYHTEFRKGHVFPNQSMSSGSYAILADQPYCVGHFVDKDKKELEAIVQYTDQTSIALHLYKGFERKTDQTIYEIHLYENQTGEDKFIECYNVVGYETEIVNYIQLPTSSAVYGSSTHEQDKGNKKNPRLFYFILYQWRGEHHEEFNQLKGQPPKRRSTYSAGSLLAPIRMYPENLGVKHKNDDSIIELEDEDEGKYIAELKNKKADQKQKQVLNQERMGTALKGITPGSKSFNETVDPFVQIHEQLEQKIKAIDREIKTLSEYKARIKRNNAKISAEKKGVKNYFKQLKLAIDPIYNEVQNRNKKRVPVKVEVGKPQTYSHDSRNCPNCKKPVTVDQLKELFKTKSKTEMSDESLLKEIADSYNKYMEKVGMNTCYDKAYFFAVMLVETGFIHRWKNESQKVISKMESMNYYKGAGKLKDFNAFKIYPDMKAALCRQEEKGEPLTKLEQIRVANFVYSSSANAAKAKELGNAIINLNFVNEKVVNVAGMDLLANENGEGWKYRGKGYFQLTGRDAYTKINGWINSLTDLNVDIVENPDLVGSNVEVATLSAMLFYTKYKGLTRYSRGLNSKRVFSGVGADIGMQDRRGAKTTNHKLKTIVFNTKEEIDETVFPSTSDVFKVSECLTFKELRIATNILTYHIYANGDIYKKIPKINKYPTKVKYIYYDKKGNKHELGVYDWFEIDELNSPTDVSLEIGYTDTYKYPSDEGIDGDTAHYYRDSAGNLKYIITTPKVGRKKDYKIKKYTVKSGRKTKLLQLEEPWSKGVKDTETYFEYTFVNTARTYCGLDQYAVFAGAFFDLNLVTNGTGIASKDGTGYPSKSHVNGQSIDLDYFTPTSETKEMIQSMKKFGCKVFYVGLTNENSAFAGLKTYGESIGVKVGQMRGHSEHIHCGPIDNTHIIEIEDE
ncbi:hypothetical protein HMPREF9716_01688 [Myroides odoratus CIP 103059]|uniref:PAAR-like protein n=1 Tax=Myroides odoratus TaxID=256 RepID=UPI000280C513|nr:PAAR-like protein [Myroides odoratus]EKB07649.1 hypothetical protein HMPREF9716_01688 [Myroides odoratus CIP 103059]